MGDYYMVVEEFTDDEGRTFLKGHFMNPGVLMEDEFQRVLAAGYIKLLGEAHDDPQAA